MTPDASTARLQPSRIRSFTILTVLVVASISGAAVAQLTADPVPLSIGQPDTVIGTETPADASPGTPAPLAFND
ncbi:MAG: hypothetical protein HKN03_12070 [Acidimicrobiales bacterium]|nr:hypothetical protein [Acidimicrobiales bacterium]